MIDMILMILLLAAIEMTQTPDVQLSISRASLVSIFSKVPLSVEQIEERTRKLPNEQSQTSVQRSKIYRDAAGRMRFETDVSIPSGGRLVYVELADPVTGFIAVLNTPSEIAYRMTIQKTNPPSGFAQAEAGIFMPGKNRVGQNLGKRLIDGIEYVGSRTSVASDDQPSLLSVDERWVSTELGLTALVEATSPNEHYSARILSVNRSNPDPKLFIIPENYRIQEMNP